MSNSAFGGVSSSNRATLIIKKKNSQETVTCHFNPEQYSVKRGLDWKVKPALGRDVPTYEFGGGASTTLDLKLLFDTSSEANKDVRDITKKIWDAAYIDKDDFNATTKQGNPPRVIFIWGRAWSFEAVITSISQQFQLFKADGTPIRAEINLTLTQVKDDRTFGRQNPTSGGVPGKVHVVREGDRLDLMAARYYDKPTQWKIIAEHNGLNNPRDLVPGTRLIIPDLS